MLLYLLYVFRLVKSCTKKFIINSVYDAGLVLEYDSPPPPPPPPQMQINKDRTWKNYRRASLRPHIQHHQLSHVTLNYSLPLAVCILMLPMLVVAVEHMQLATTYRMNPLDRCNHMTFIWTPLVLPTPNNVLPAMVLQSRGVRLNTGYASCFSSYTYINVQSVSLTLSLRVFFSVARTVVAVVVILRLLLSGDVELNPGPLGEYL